jgi:hypothetical protein
MSRKRCSNNPREGCPRWRCERYIDNHFTPPELRLGAIPNARSRCCALPGIRVDEMQAYYDRIDTGVSGRMLAGSLRDIVDVFPIVGRKTHILIPHCLNSSVLVSPTVLSLSALPLPISPCGLCGTICSSLSFIVVSIPVISWTVRFFPCLSTWLRRRLSGSALLELSCEGLAEETACRARLMKGFRMGKFTAMMPTNWWGCQRFEKQGGEELGAKYCFADRPYGADVDLRDVLQTENTS